MTIVLCFISFLVGAAFAFVVLALLSANDAHEGKKWWE